MIGDLRERVELQALTLAPDGAGGGAQAWATYATVWAAVIPVATTSQFTADKEERRRRYRVTVRYRSDVTFAVRVSYEGRALEITDIQTAEERGRFLILGCEEAGQ
ncbi:MAG: phage head closure protein [Pseudomonadota bacterium]